MPPSIGAASHHQAAISHLHLRRLPLFTYLILFVRHHLLVGSQSSDKMISNSIARLAAMLALSSSVMAAPAAELSITAQLQLADT